MGTGFKYSSFDWYMINKGIKKQEEYYKENHKKIYEAKMNDTERRKSVAEGYKKYIQTGDKRLKVYETWQKSYDRYDSKKK